MYAIWAISLVKMAYNDLKSVKVTWVPSKIRTFLFNIKGWITWYIKSIKTKHILE